MTTRHGVSSLRLLRRVQPSPSSSRSFSVSGYLKEHDPKEHNSKRTAPPLKTSDYDYRKPSYAARRNFPAHIRHLMRSTPNHLTVIISRPPGQSRDDELSATSEDQQNGPVKENDMERQPKFAGLLVSSFNTVTLTPKPYVSFNIKLPSSTYSAIKASNEFTASGLKDARIADAFVKRKFTPGDFYGDNIWHDLVDMDGHLKEGKGGTWWMRCRLSKDKSLEVGDHMIVVAKVLESGGYAGGEGIGLVYAEGGYRKVGEVVDMKEEKGNYWEEDWT